MDATRDAVHEGASPVAKWLKKLQNGQTALVIGASAGVVLLAIVLLLVLL